jgi:glucosamine 6-phosphate synthetase-like amidotransferase/phosphosugar isomerase protein
MCGIAGVMRQGVWKLTPAGITNLLLQLQTRGTDATGVAWCKDGLVNVLKSPQKAEDFVQTDEFKRDLQSICDADWALFHTRQATHGNPQNNLNNHPVHNENGLLIHNGIVYPEEKLEAQGETDSEQILLHLQKDEWSGLKTFSGSMAIAYVNYKHVDRFYLYRHFSPIEYGRCNDLFVFGSTQAILQEVFGKEFKTKILPANSVYKVTADRMKQLCSVKIKTLVTTYHPMTDDDWRDYCSHLPNWYNTYYTPSTQTTPTDNYVPLKYRVVKSGKGDSDDLQIRADSDLGLTHFAF